MTQVRTKLGKVGFSPRGLWKVGTAYERLDVVTFFGSSFVSLSENNTEPLTDETKWMPIAKKGDKGDAFIYDDFTPEQLKLLQGEKGDGFKWEDFTPEQIENLKQPATEAAQVALDAASEALNVPKIQDGYFWLYSVEQKKYVKSNSKATGRSPQARDGIWWEYNDEIGDYVSTNISASSDYELTKEKVENVLTGDITSHNHATQLAEALANYVQIVAGKQLSTEDFTTAFKNKLTGLENYNDAAVVASIAAVNGRLDTLIGTSASEAIDTFREIEAFLQGITDTKTLTGLLSDLKAEIVTLIPTKLSQLQNDDNTVKDASYQHTDNNYTAADKAKLDGIEEGATKFVDAPADGKSYVRKDAVWHEQNSEGVELYSENDDMEVVTGVIVNAGSGWNSFTFPYEFSSIPSVSCARIDGIIGIVNVQNVTKTGFMYQVTSYKSSNGFVDTSAEVKFNYIAITK